MVFDFVFAMSADQGSGQLTALILYTTFTLAYQPAGIPTSMCNLESGKCSIVAFPVEGWNEKCT